MTGSILNLNQLLSSPQVHVKDIKALTDKLSKFVAGGADQLMVISDFDFTLSRFADKSGNRCSSCYCVFDNAVGTNNPEWCRKFVGLYHKYGPVEHDHSLSIEEKVPFMEAWWQQSHELIIQGGFKREAIDDYVSRCNIQLRDNADIMMKKMTNHSVPFIIFSAGIGTIIEMYLKHKFGKVEDNTHIVSNMMGFDQDGYVNSFSDPLIHVFCKNSSVMPADRTFSEQIHGRRNVILLGDSVGDAFMDVGVEEEQLSLKIGFVNHDADKLVDKYLNYFDIVLVHDQSMNVPNQILEAIYAKSH
ncbi:Protein CBG13827 [Caenorhabditis briggsae]|uniref:5'-nucleotidase n=1 Tax=Caenorhabditis briggsae TaxID=6238 RepID=A8XIS7_CAEBR|nr:Protein CBG13827 [Caenorhabditis briggsae]CAP32552.1 Protein CBG13827 [Caenorhabditis briggsae]